MTVTSMMQRSFPGMLRSGEGRGTLPFSPRRLAPFALIPLGTLYCELHEIFFGNSWSSLDRSLTWAVATLTPWVAAALVFEARIAAGDSRRRVVRRAVLLGLLAYGASAAAALLLGADGERAFLSRMPLLAAAMLCAILYPIPAPEEAPVEVAPGDAAPPVAPGEIVFARAAGNYIELHARGRTFVWRQTMHNAERILGPGFVRVHRSYLVPWRSIQTVTRGRKGPVEVALHNGPSLPVSNRYAMNLHS